MNKRCFYTSFNRAYASQALILAESIRNCYGNSVDIVALLVDDLEEGEQKYFTSFTKILKASELNIPNFSEWIFRLDIIEAATAVKPFALRQLLDTYEEVIYLDPDTIVYTPLDEMFDALKKNNFVLTPHQLTPSTENWVIESTELQSLRFGIFNLGFIAVRNTVEGKRVADWWMDRCYEYCISDPDRGLFTDQKFFDQAPIFFDGLHILKHPGYNVATWNLRERVLRFVNGNVVVNDQPLRFCHFTKATHIGASAFERMSRGIGVMDELFYGYLSLMAEKELYLLKLTRNWHYGNYKDGTPIEKETRIQFREFFKSKHVDVDPFNCRTDTEVLIR